MMEGVNPAKIHFKHICRSPLQLLHTDTIINKIKLSFYKFKTMKRGLSESTLMYMLT
jgi:hypothetical protein